MDRTGIEILDQYMARTGQPWKEVMSGAAFYGYMEILELVAEAQRLNKTLIFYYEDNEAMENDTPSYRFE